MQRECRIRGIQERTDIERRTRLRGNPALIYTHQFPDRLQPVLLIDPRQTDTVARAVQTRHIFPRAEKLHAAVRTAVGLEPLKHLSAVVQHARGGRHADRPEGDDARIVPAVGIGIVHEKHMIGKIFSEAELIRFRQLSGVLFFSDCNVHNEAPLFRYCGCLSNAPCWRGCRRSRRGAAPALLP